MASDAPAAVHPPYRFVAIKWHSAKGDFQSNASAIGERGIGLRPIVL
jgi:hypothetical protein